MYKIELINRNVIIYTRNINISGKCVGNTLDLLDIEK